MNKTKIEWCNYTINPVKGLCPMACPYCYARAMYKRFKWNPRRRYDPSAWLGLGSLQKPSRIFVGSTYELFHSSIPEKYLKWILEVPKEFPQHTFIFLTKQPQNLIRWSPFPGNCWVGVTALNNAQLLLAEGQLERIEAKVKFLSLEPLLNELDGFKFMKCNLDWLILGQQTPISAKTQPNIEWIREIVEAAKTAEIPIFLKDNLSPLLPSGYGCDYNHWAYKNGQLRQEFPNV